MKSFLGSRRQSARRYSLSPRFVVKRSESRNRQAIAANVLIQISIADEPQNGEKPFAVLTRKVIKEEMKAHTPSQAGNLLSALRGVIRWMIDEGHLNEDDDPTEVRQGEG
jgi:hypothetical protein